MELLGKDNMKLSSKQVASIIELMKKEDTIQKHEKEAKLKGKQEKQTEDPPKDKSPDQQQEQQTQ